MDELLDYGRLSGGATNELLAAQAREIAALKEARHRLQDRVEQLARDKDQIDVLLHAPAPTPEPVDGRCYPLVSVITPCFNHARYIRETIESVLAQDYPYIEHIIVDGGSVDGTVEILRTYEIQYPGRIRWISEPDQGQSDAFNKGLAMARGQIIGWQNSDDFYYPNVFAEPVHYLMDHPEVGVVYSDCDTVDICRNVVGRFSVCAFDLPRLLRMTCVANQTAFIRKEVLTAVGGVALDYHFAMDHDLWLRLALVTVFAYLPGVRGAFRMQPDAKTQRGYIWNRLEVVASLRHLAEHPLFPSEHLPALHHGVAQYALQAMKLAIIQHQDEIASQSLALALHYDTGLERFTDLCTKLLEGMVTVAKQSTCMAGTVDAALPRVALAALHRDGRGGPQQLRRMVAIACLYQAIGAAGRSPRAARAYALRALTADPWWVARQEVTKLVLQACDAAWVGRRLPWLYRHKQRGRWAVRRLRGTALWAATALRRCERAGSMLARHVHAPGLLPLRRDLGPYRGSGYATGRG